MKGTISILLDYSRVTETLARPLIERDHCPVIVIGLADDGRILASGHAGLTEEQRQKVVATALLSSMQTGRRFSDDEVNGLLAARLRRLLGRRPLQRRRSNMSKIEWTDKTISVIVVKGEDGKPNGWYCERVSQGCTRCYAERLNGTSFYGGNGLPYRQGRAGRPELMLRRDVMAKWARTRKPYRLFLNSMTDTFGEFVPKEWIYEMLDAMTAASLVTFQVLTKRAERMNELVMAWLEARSLDQVPANIWLGFSAEDQQYFDRRAEWVLRIPAAVKFVSYEPALGPIDMRWALHYPACPQHPGEVAAGWGHLNCDCRPYQRRNKTGLEWIIIGGESGHGARPFNVAWARDIIEQCRAADVAVFAKQLGKRPYEQQGQVSRWPVGTVVDFEGEDRVYFRLKDSKAGNPDEWPEDLRVREFPVMEVVDAA